MDSVSTALLLRYHNIPLLVIILSHLLSQSYQQITCGLMFGFAYGVYVTNKILILQQIGDDLVSALGLDQLCGSISSVVGPVSIGKKERLETETITKTFPRSCV